MVIKMLSRQTLSMLFHCSAICVMVPMSPLINTEREKVRVHRRRQLWRGATWERHSHSHKVGIAYFKGNPAKRNHSFEANLFH